MKLILIFFILIGVTLPAGAKVYLISDNDDTLEITGIRTDWKKIVDNSVRHKAFAGMSSLYNYLASNGVNIQYLSGSPAGDMTLHFLTENHFPQGPLTHRPSPLGVKPKDYPKTVDFKVDKGIAIMLDIISKDSDAQFLFTGDNGEKDPISFSRIKADPRVSKYILGMFIHQLYPESIATPLGEGQIGYVSAVELALHLSQGNLVSQDQIQRVATEVANSAPHLVVPTFGTVTPEEATKLHDLAESSQNEETQAAVEKVVHLEQALCPKLVNEAAPIVQE